MYVVLAKEKSWTHDCIKQAGSESFESRLDWPAVPAMSGVATLHRWLAARLVRGVDKHLCLFAALSANEQASCEV